MKTAELIQEIQRLPIEKRIYIIEKTMHSMLDDNSKNKIMMAAEALYEDYCSDEELTVFTDLDQENFYEAR
ncbi:MAG: hypothetical protein PHF33_04585 [Candidatus Delongbacteria bacterium]|jgi:hypothetical protein|nr:hypothetical protein [Candidatus Delongbacteria bacterium]MDY0017755.1 hypothetical protein [Candidatus Delongbacteria bacterium]